MEWIKDRTPEINENVICVTEDNDVVECNWDGKVYEDILRGYRVYPVGWMPRNVLPSV